LKFSLLSAVKGSVSPASGRLLVDPVGRGAGAAGFVLPNTSAGPSTALSNFTAQRAFDTYATIPANSLQVGSLIRIRYQGIQTAVNGTDTIQPILNIGGTLAASTLAVTGGTALLTADGDDWRGEPVFHGEYELADPHHRLSGTMVGWASTRRCRRLKRPIRRLTISWPRPRSTPRLTRSSRSASFTARRRPRTRFALRLHAGDRGLTCLALTLLEEITQKLGGLSPDDKKAVVADAVAATANMKWVPNPGPQTDAYFCPADVLLYGGQGGGGKSDLGPRSGVHGTSVAR
jgi:hypothetical protein